MRRVVVTGLGAVTPLGIGKYMLNKALRDIINIIAAGVSRSWARLLNGYCGVESLRDRGEAFSRQQCQVAGLVPLGNKSDGAWDAGDWLSKDVGRST